MLDLRDAAGAPGHGSCLNSFRNVFRGVLWLFSYRRWQSYPKSVLGVSQSVLCKPPCLRTSFVFCLFPFLLVCLCACLLACLFARVLARLPTCLPARLPACALACLPAWLRACWLVCLLANLLTCLFACQLACLLACLPSCLLYVFACLIALPASLPACLPACLRTCLLAWLPGCLLACLCACLPTCFVQAYPCVICFCFTSREAEGVLALSSALLQRASVHTRSLFRFFAFSASILTSLRSLSSSYNSTPIFATWKKLMPPA